MFNIRGNAYRLVVAINSDHQVLFIKWLGTHREYDRINVEEVQYDESRYGDTSSSDRRRTPHSPEED